MIRQHRWLTVAVMSLIVVIVAGGMVLLLEVHSATANWWPSAIPTRVQYNGRNFTCPGVDAAQPTSRAALVGLEARGHTIGGGTIYAPPGSTLPTGIVVAAGEELRQCSLSGAP